MVLLRELLRLPSWVRARESLCDWHPTFGDLENLDVALLAPFCDGGCLVCKYTEFIRSKPGFSPDVDPANPDPFSYVEKALNALNERSIETWSSNDRGELVLANGGNDKPLDYFLENSIYTNGLTDLFVAPAGIGKTKFGPAKIMAMYGCRSCVMVSERVSAIDGAFDWYVKHPLPGLEYIEKKAGGVLKKWGNPKGSSVMRLYTTGAYVDNQFWTQLDANTLLLVDEAHNVSVETLVATTTKSKLLKEPRHVLSMTASPIQQSVKVSFSTPLPSTVTLLPMLSDWRALDDYKEGKTKRTLIICPGRGKVLEVAKLFWETEVRPSIYVVFRGTCARWTPEKMVGTSLEALPELMKRDYSVCVATEILQESVTLPIDSIYDYGQRYRPAAWATEDFPLDADDAVEFAVDQEYTNAHDPMRDVLLHEIVQVAGRVGRTKESANGRVFIGSAVPVNYLRPIDIFGTQKCPKALNVKPTGWLRKPVLETFKRQVKEFNDSSFKGGGGLSRSTKMTKKTLEKWIDFGSGPFIHGNDVKRLLHGLYTINYVNKVDQAKTNDRLRNLPPPPSTNPWTVRLEKRLNTLKVPSRPPTPNTEESESEDEAEQMEQILAATPGNSYSNFEPSAGATTWNSAEGGAEPTETSNTNNAKVLTPSQTKVKFLSTGFFYDGVYSSWAQTAPMLRHERPRKATIRLPGWNAQEAKPDRVAARGPTAAVGLRVSKPSKKERIAILAEDAIPSNPVRTEFKGKTRRERKALSESDAKAYCYLYLFPEDQRADAKRKLGKLPRLFEVDDLLRDRSYLSASTLELSQARGGFSHVTPSLRSRRDFLQYWERLVYSRPNIRLGLEPNLAHRIVSGAYSVDEIYQLLEEEEEAATSPKMVEIKVRSPGDCWKKLRGPIGLSGTDVTVRQVLENEENLLRHNDYIRWTVEEDGDVHIVASHSATQIAQRNQRYAKELLAGAKPDAELKWSTKGRFRKLPDYSTTVEFLDALKKMGSTRLVGNTHDEPIDPVSKAVAAMSTAINLEAIDNLRFEPIRKAINVGHAICPWVVPSHNKLYMNNWGIPFSATAAVTHSHPVHAAMRRHLYSNVVPKLLPAGGDLYWTKPDHAQLAGPSELYQVRNSHVSAKDFSRYLDVESMTSLLKTEKEKVFFGECAQFFTPADVMAFHRANPGLKVAYWSGVIPPESLFTQHSLHPTLYTFKVTGPTMLYSPENDEDEYEQPVAGHWWYTTSSIQCMKTRVTVTREYRKGPFFVMSTTTEDVLEETKRSFPEMGCVRLPSLAIDSPMKEMVVSPELIHSLLLYGESLSNCQPRDLMAQLRRLYRTSAAQGLPLHEAKFLVLLVMQLLRQGSNLDYSSEFTTFKSYLYDQTIRRVWKRTFGAWSARNDKLYLETLNTWENAVVIKTQRVQVLLLNGLVRPNALLKDKATTFVEAAVKENFGNLVTTVPMKELFWNVYRGVLANDQLKTAEAEVKVISQPLDGKPIPREVLNATLNNNETFEFLNPEEIMREHSLSEQVTVGPENWLKKQFDRSKAPVSLGGRFRIEEPALAELCEEPASDMDEILANIIDVADSHTNLLPACDRAKDISLNETLIDASEVAVVYSSQETETLAHCGRPHCKEHIASLGKESTCAEGFCWNEEGQSCHACKSSEQGMIAGFEEALAEILKMDAKNIRKLVDAGKDVRSNLDSVCSSLKVSVFVVGDLTMTAGDGAARNVGTLYNCKGCWFTKKVHGDPYVAYMHEIEKTDDPEPGDPLKVELKTKLPTIDAEKTILGVNLGQLMRLGNTHGREQWMTAKFGVTKSQRWNARSLGEPTSGKKLFVPMSEGDCLLKTFGDITGLSKENLFTLLKENLTKETEEELTNEMDGYSTHCLEVLALATRTNVLLTSDVKEWHMNHFGVKTGLEIPVVHKDNHFSIGSHAVKLRFKVTGDPSLPKHLREKLESFVKWKPYRPSKERGEAYLRAIRSGTTGTLLRTCGEDTIKVHEESVAKETNARDIKLCLNAGDPGSGKSFTAADLLQDNGWWVNPGSVSVVTPTNELCLDWARKLNLIERQPKARGTSCCTFETALRSANPRVLVIDEISKFPPGYVDAFVLLHASVEYVLLLGDPHQCEWHEPNDQCVLNDESIHTPEAAWFAAYCENYTVGSLRLARQVASVLGLPSKSRDNVSCFRSVAFANSSQPVITPSRQSANAIIEYWQGDSTTWTSSQGKDWSSDYTVVVDRNYLTFPSHNALWTALTRGKKNVNILWKDVSEGAWQSKILSDPLLSRLWKITHGCRLASLEPFDSLLYVGSQHNVMWKKRRLFTSDVNDVTNWGDLNGPVYVGDEKADSGLKELKVTLRDGTTWVEEARGATGENTLTSAEKAYRRVKRNGDPIENLGALAYSCLMDPDVVREEKPPEEAVREEVTNERFLRGNRKDLLEEIVGHLKPKEERELRDSKGLASNQFTEGALENLPPRFSVGTDVNNTHAIVCPTGGDGAITSGIHNMRKSDEVAAKAAIVKRLRFASIEQKNKSRVDGASTSQILFENFAQVCPRLGLKKFSWDLYEDEVKNNEANRFRTKLPAVVVNASERASPDFGAGHSLDPHLFVDISFKSEMKCKAETLGADAKALQTIMTMHESAFVKFNPMVRVCTKLLLEALPENMYVHIGKNPEDLNEFAKKHWRFKKGRAIDYTAFDQGQNAVVAEAIFKVYELLGVPQKLLNDFRTWKYNLKSKYGEHDVQRFTGESETIFGNTLTGIMLALSAYDLSQGCKMKVPTFFVGDDALWPEFCTPKSSFNLIKKHIQIEVKEEIQEAPNFVGWRITAAGIYKDPVLIWYKHRARTELRISHLSLVSYLHEFAFAFRLPDLDQHLTDLESRCHQAMLREFCRNKFLMSRFGHVLKGEAPDESYFEFELDGSHRNREKAWLDQAADDRKTFVSRLNVLKLFANWYENPPETVGSALHTRLHNRQRL